MRARGMPPAAPAHDPLWHSLLGSVRVLVGSLVLILAALWGWFAWSAARAEVQFEGAPMAEARIVGIERRATGGKGASAVYARYRFHTADGRAVRGEDQVPASERASLERIGKASVQYLAADPRRNRLYFPWMTTATAARASRVEAGIVLLMLAVGGWLVWSGCKRAVRDRRAGRSAEAGESRGAPLAK